MSNSIKEIGFINPINESMIKLLLSLVSNKE